MGHALVRAAAAERGSVMQGGMLDGKECGGTTALLPAKLDLQGEAHQGKEDSNGCLGATFVATGSEPDSMDWECIPLSQLAIYIVNHYHLPCRHELQRMGQLFSRVSRALGDALPQLRAAHQEFQRLRREVLTRMMREQQVIFPAITDLELGYEANPEQLKSSLATSIKKMLAEQSAWSASLESMRCTCQVGQEHYEMRCLCEGLRTFEEILAHCVKVESAFLFPRALALKNTRQLYAHLA